MFPVAQFALPDGEATVLVEATGKVDRTMTPDKARLLQQLVSLAAARGWKPGAVYYKFKEKHGHAPASREEVEALVSKARERMSRTKVTKEELQAAFDE